VTVTVEPTFSSPFTVVLATRLITHSSLSFWMVILELLTATTLPVIVAVWAKSELRATLPATITQSNDFIFITTLDRCVSPNASFYARCSLDLFRSSLPPSALDIHPPFVIPTGIACRAVVRQLRDEGWEESPNISVKSIHHKPLMMYESTM